MSLAGSGSVGSLWLGQDSSGCDDQNLVAGEFLFELTGQTLLDLVEVGQQRDWNEDDDGFSALADLELKYQLVSVCIGIPIFIPRELRRIAGASEQPSGRRCWSRVRRSHLRGKFRVHLGGLLTGCWQQSC